MRIKRPVTCDQQAALSLTSFGWAQTQTRKKREDSVRRVSRNKEHRLLMGQQRDLSSLEAQR